MGLTGVFETDAEAHAKGIGDALQLFERDILLATRHGIQIRATHPYQLCQLSLTDVFFPSPSSSRCLFVCSLKLKFGEYTKTEGAQRNGRHPLKNKKHFA